MNLEILTLTLGPMDNKTYLAADPFSKQAVVIDPSFDSQTIFSALEKRGWNLAAVWLTHAHFDHTAGVRAIIAHYPEVPVGLHPDDLNLWRAGGGASLFGIHHDSGPEPALPFQHDQVLKVGGVPVEVRHTPGHSPGHVIFYAASENTVFCGDLIFIQSVGRTDLPGGSHATLLASIRTQVLTLPPETRLLPGHGAETTVGAEAAKNPFL
jgi:glyoxylase-like metal-dependent hydrolase (beta-lactamase superfamily II)